MASSFELSDEQPPEANRLRRPFKPSGKKICFENEERFFIIVN
jgi:hypothetical protein